MKIKLLTPTLLSLGFFILLTPIFAIAQDTPEPVELKLELRDEITENQVKELLQDKDYLITNLKGEVKVGDETITDFISKGKGETLEDVDELFQEQRQTLLVNMLQTQELSEENSKEMKQQFRKDELLTTIRETKNRPVKVKEISVITENQDKAQAIKDSLQNRSEIKVVRESIKEIQAEQKEFRQENRALKWLRNTLNFLFAPLRAVANGSTPVWVPDFTSIAFFDTDEVGLNPYEDWDNFNSMTGVDITDIESHWWRTYLVADGGTWHTDKISRFSQEDGSGFEPWRDLPLHTPDPNRNMMNHELVSLGNDLYMFYQVSKPNFLGYPPFELFVRKSTDGGYTWTNPVEVNGHPTAYTATKHNGNICIASEYQDATIEIQIKCVSDPLTYDWTNVTWETIQDEVAWEGNRTIDMESQFGTLWISYLGANWTGDLEVKSSYDNGETWNDVLFGDNLQDETARKVGVAEVELTAVGTWNDQNERLCLTAGRYDSSINGDMVEQTCLFRYFDENGQYNAWNWTPWQKQELGIGNGVQSAVETTSDTSRLAMVGTANNDKYSRTLQYQATPGRGYISYMRWDEKPYGNNTNDAYEHEIYLNLEDWGATYIDDDNTTAGCYPQINYAATNLPDGYLDTRLDYIAYNNYTLYIGPCDPVTGFPSFTIGTPEGDQIQEDTLYYTYISGDKGLILNANFAVFSQDSEKHFFQNEWGVFNKSGDSKRVLIDCYQTESYNMCPREEFPYWYEEREDGNYRFQQE